MHYHQLLFSAACLLCRISLSLLLQQPLDKQQPVHTQPPALTTRGEAFFTHRSAHTLPFLLTPIPDHTDPYLCPQTRITSTIVDFVQSGQTQAFIFKEVGEALAAEWPITNKYGTWETYCQKAQTVLLATIDCSTKFGIWLSSPRGNQGEGEGGDYVIETYQVRC